MTGATLLLEGESVGASSSVGKKEADTGEEESGCGEYAPSAGFPARWGNHSVETADVVPESESESDTARKDLDDGVEVQRQVLDLMREGDKLSEVCVTENAGSIGREDGGAPPADGGIPWQLESSPEPFRAQDKERSCFDTVKKPKNDVLKKLKRAQKSLDPHDISVFDGLNVLAYFVGKFSLKKWNGWWVGKLCYDPLTHPRKIVVNSGSDGGESQSAELQMWSEILVLKDSAGAKYLTEVIERAELSAPPHSPEDKLWNPEQAKDLLASLETANTEMYSVIARENETCTQIARYM
eukprot:CAMPEP_0181340282 /NCGR_PEP_ID=MMETSP1101-20121128/29753_1 /TAXON_ID=46948 /ORGANISM="Rhodomonas abbreviata, Strain Caron Lab Isolate" /LENGTH=296 /DNA_ID=CAMNT_0023451401 /DNA_START=63 /DNA_END=950 /DNA_ORIENTATION=+